MRSGAGESPAFWVLAAVMVLAAALAGWGLVSNWKACSDGPGACAAFPHVGKLVAGVLVASATAFIIMARQGGVRSDDPADTRLVYSEMFATAIVYQAASRREANQQWTYLADHLQDNVEHASPEIRQAVHEELAKAVKKIISLRFGGHEELQEQADVMAAELRDAPDAQGAPVVPVG